MLRVQGLSVAAPLWWDGSLHEAPNHLRNEAPNHLRKEVPNHLREEVPNHFRERRLPTT